MSGVSGNTAALAAAAEQLRALHHGPVPLVLANAWDAASARLVEELGFPVVATTSAGVALSLGHADGEATPPLEMFAAVARIATAVGVPVTADVEGGYGLDPPELVERLLGAAAVGLNFEDTDHRRGGLLDADAQAARVAGVREAALAAGVSVVINARVDVFVRGAGDEADHVDEAVRRAELYLAAGADCVYPITAGREDTIGALCERIDGPVNVLLRDGVPPVARLAELGVRRVSVGSGLFRAALGAARETASQLRAAVEP